jgi:Dyp-type peroxidase family
MTDEIPAECLIQSHFVRAGRQGSELKKRRDWSLFMFFRVMSQQEATQSLDRILGPEVAAEPSGLNLNQLEIELLNPTLWTPFVPDPAAGVSFVGTTPPVQLFLRWLKAVTGDGHDQLIADLNRLKARVSAAATNQAVERASLSLLVSGETRPSQHTFVDIFASIEQLAKDDARDHGLGVLRGGLARVCAYEVIREIVRAAQEVPVARSSATEGQLVELPGDRSPIEIAFTYSGLGAVGVNERVLKSFPDVFKEGMAARASRLGDVGKSAPSQWDGELGQSAIHGMLVGGFAVEGAKDQDWERLRREIRLFNEAGPEGAKLREAVGLVFRGIGLEILHIELGQDPYEIADDGTITPREHRYEHFGFRDGISQPTMDLPGSGTPGGNGSWIPVAPGEIFLGAKDEDGCIQAAPSHTDLKKGGTYLVFRKLKQDVAGFRSFLESARPGSKSQQDRLAAQFVGRWRNGVSMVRAPTAQPDLGEEQEVDLNNFRYVEEDPTGRYCPLGAHVRRANPRDIGGQAEAKRHRILRRGMAYGGPFLAQDSAGDGKERGMLFIAANARIDVQFELIQSRWLNGGEFLGQAGLNKCPITGAHAGGPGDQFVSADNAMPVNRIPRFVQTRGGDYFFAPGIDGLKAIANSRITEPNSWVPNEIGHNSAKTEDVFSSDNIRKLIGITLSTGHCQQVFKPIVGAGGLEDPTTGQPIVFVGQHAHVKKVLSGELSSVGVRHYLDASERMMSGARILISTETGDAELREPMKAVLKRAWEVLNPYKAFNEVLDDAISRAIGRTKQVGRIDLVHDLAVDPVYQLVANVYGVPGPNWLTELAVSLPFGSRHISELHPDWLAMLSGKAPQNPRLATLQVWSILMFSDLIGNVRNQEELKILAMEAASEFTLYLEQLLLKEQTKPRKKPNEVRTLLEAFCAIEGETFAGKTFTRAQYYRIARLLLTELVPSALAVIPATFGWAIAALLSNRVNLSYVVPYLDKVSPTEGVRRLIYEMNRLSPSLPFLQRYATEDVLLSDAIKIDKGNWIGALIVAANLDERVFPQANTFSLGPQLQPNGPKRDLDDYIMFGGVGSDRECFGRDRLAMLALVKFIRAAARLPGLRRVAGPGGAPIEIIRTMIGLPARFARF